MPRKEYYQQNKEKLREYNRNHLRRWREKIGYRKREDVQLQVKAHNTVNNAINTGKLERQLCEEESCFNPGEAHHEDYGKPLEVLWVCKSHHELLHH